MFKIGEKVVPRCKLNGPYLKQSEVFTVDSESYAKHEGGTEFRQCIKFKGKKGNFTEHSYIKLSKAKPKIRKVCEMEVRRLKNEIEYLNQRKKEYTDYLHSVLPNL